MFPHMHAAASNPAFPPNVEMSPCGDVALSALEAALLEDFCYHRCHAEMAEKHHKTTEISKLISVARRTDNWLPLAAG